MARAASTISARRVSGSRRTCLLSCWLSLITIQSSRRLCSSIDGVHPSGAVVDNQLLALLADDMDVVPGSAGWRPCPITPLVCLAMHRAGVPLLTAAALTGLLGACGGDDKPNQAANADVTVV